MKPYPTNKEIEEKFEEVYWSIHPMAGNDELEIARHNAVTARTKSFISSIRSADLEWFLEVIEGRRQENACDRNLSIVNETEKCLRSWYAYGNNSTLDSLKEEILKIKQ